MHFLESSWRYRLREGPTSSGGDELTTLDWVDWDDPGELEELEELEGPEGPAPGELPAPSSSLELGANSAVAESGQNCKSWASDLILT